MNIYVGNLAHEVTDDDLKKAFEVYGDVTSANIIKDRFSNESRGFGFVEMPDHDQAQEAINGLNSQEIKGRYLKVSEARPKKDNRKKRSSGGGHRRW